MCFYGFGLWEAAMLWGGLMRVTLVMSYEFMKFDSFEKLSPPRRLLWENALDKRRMIDD